MAKTSIKTAYLGGQVDGAITIATGVPLSESIRSWITQDNIRVVAMEVGIAIPPDDTQSNTDGAYEAKVQLSRVGTIDQDSAFLEASITCTWNGVVAIGGPTASDKVLSYPQGAGIDLDPGDGLDLLAFVDWIGTTSLHGHVYAIVHYIER